MSFISDSATLAAIRDLEKSIRSEFKERAVQDANREKPLTTKRYEVLIVGGIAPPRVMAEHALWQLDQARRHEERGDKISASLCFGVAAGLVLPYGMAASYRLDPVTIHPAMVAHGSKS